MEREPVETRESEETQDIVPGARIPRAPRQLPANEETQEMVSTRRKSSALVKKGGKNRKKDGSK